MNWFYNDDLATLRWFAQADAGGLRFTHLFELWNNEHPVGAQFALLWLARLAFDLDMRGFVALSICVVAITAGTAAHLTVDRRDPPSVQCAAVAACFALAFQPSQMEHLLWSFELGWFVVNLAVLADASLVERLGPRAALPVAAICAFASLASAQGALAFPAAALHQALLPARRGEGPPSRSSRWAALSLWRTCCGGRTPPRPAPPALTTILAAWRSSRFRRSAACSACATACRCCSPARL